MESQTAEELLARWEWSGYPQDLGQDLLDKYGEPHRRYHTAEHLQAMFRLLDSDPRARAVGLSVEDRTALELALWYHDREYEPTRSDSELRSAVQFLGDAPGLRLSQALRCRVVDLILRTRRHDPPPDDAAASLLCDLDLAVLGSSPAAYAEYARAVRSEFAHLGDGLFALGRRRFLDTALARPALFRVLVDREEPARENLRDERDRLMGTLEAARHWLAEDPRTPAALARGAALVAGSLLLARQVLVVPALVAAAALALVRASRGHLALERAARTGRVPFPDEPGRRALWEVLSLFYLDTQFEPEDLAVWLRETGYGREEAARALREEVGPVVWVNLLSVAGEWQAFDPEWLRTRIRERALRGRPAWGVRLEGCLATCAIRGEFEEVLDLAFPPGVLPISVGD